ncbi:hypothetical protein ASE01_16430 [Nocardioides sp. Root190]|nr:hypothetical protein ASE01_16430 [Nocardioides sp. Root190]
MLGRYRVDRLLGRGGMGSVYAATDTDLGRSVAVKVISAAHADDAELVARFRREAEVLARLDSPHIIAIFDHGVADGTPYLVTQLVRGGDLEALVEQRGPLPTDLAVGCVAQVATALDDAHRAGILHRDIKPSNVLLRDPDDRPLFAYLCDFGIAQPDSGTRHTEPGGLVGTFAYLAPERADAQPATAASDVYALGCLLWYVLTGWAPYEGSPAALVQAHASAPVPQLPSEDPAATTINAALRSAMAKDPRHRFASAGDFARALTAPGTRPAPAAPTVAGPVQVAAGPGPAPSRRRLRASAVAVSVLAVLVALTLVLVLRPWADDDVDPSAAPDTDPSTVPTDPSSGPTAAPYDGPVAFDLDGNGFGDLVVFDGDSPPGFGINYYSDGSSLTPEKRTDPDRRAASVWGDVAPGTKGLEQVSLVYRGSSQEIVVLVTDDTGRELSSLRSDIELDTASTPDLVTGDFDGDDRDDVAMLHLDADGTTRLSVLRAGENGRLEAPADWGTPADAPPDASAMWAADADRDGLDDLLLGAPTEAVAPGEDAARYDGPTGFQVLLSTGTSFDVEGDRVVEPLIDLGVSVIDDFLATDGVSGVTVVIRDGRVQVRLFEYDGQRFAARGTPQAFDWEGGDVSDHESEPGVAAPRVTRADFDGDGYIDLAFAFTATSAGEESIWVMRNEAGTFAAPEKWGVLDDCETSGFCITAIDDQRA